MGRIDCEIHDCIVGKPQVLRPARDVGKVGAVVDGLTPKI